MIFLGYLIIGLLGVALVFSLALVVLVLRNLDRLEGEFSTYHLDLPEFDCD